MMFVVYLVTSEGVYTNYEQHKTKLIDAYKNDKNLKTDDDVLMNETMNQFKQSVQEHPTLGMQLLYACAFIDCMKDPIITVEVFLEKYDEIGDCNEAFN